MARPGYVWDGTQFVAITAPLGAFPNAVANYDSIAPSNPKIGQVWFDASNNVIKVWNGSSWITNTIGSNTLNINAIKHPSSSINNIVLNSDGTLGGTIPYPNRNLLYNGAMQVAQRGTSVTGITSSSAPQTADRWAFAVVSQGTWTQDIQTDAPTGSGFRRSFRALCTTADAAPAASDLVIVSQLLEGQDLQRIAKGTASAQKLTLSFWVKSNVTGTYIADLVDTDNNRQVSASYTISASATWEKKTITFPADTTGAFDNDNALSMRVRWWLGAGSDYTSGTLATTWGSITAANSAVGQTNLAAATNNYWQVTGVQLETGSTATPFEFKSFGQELRECQRYYYRITPGADTGNFGPGYSYSTTQTVICTTFPVSMRARPTALEQSGTAADYRVLNGSGGNVACNTVPVFVISGLNSAETVAAVASGLTAGQGTMMRATNATAYLAWSAEI